MASADVFVLFLYCNQAESADQPSNHNSKLLLIYWHISTVDSS